MERHFAFAGWTDSVVDSHNLNCCVFPVSYCAGPTAVGACLLARSVLV